MKLSNTTLKNLPAGISAPAYDRSQLKPGILHFGVGNFHRAHQARYLDDLFALGRDLDWAIVGAGVLEGERRIYDILGAQDWMSSLVEQSAESAEARVIGSIIDFVEPANAPAIIAALADPAIRIVSLTVTEGGYFLDSKGNFNTSHPAIVADAANPDSPKTLFGLLFAGLTARRAAGVPPFTVMTCDNIPHNGEVVSRAVCGYARLVDEEFARWIEENVAFPNSMVDRITPATGDSERQRIVEEYGIEDGWPVFSEDFIQWVLEDNFPLGRPALEDVGVQFVPDVTPYERMKLRILNGGHQTISNASGLLEVEFVDDAMAHPLIRPFLDKVEVEEIIPVVPPVPDTDTREYYDLIARRFSNPKVADRTRRLCFDGSNKQAKFILDSMRDGLAQGRSIEGLALQNALWCRYCYGTTESGKAIEPNDPIWGDLTAIAKAAKYNPRAWLEQRQIYGELAEDPQFEKAFSAWLDMVWTRGTEAALKAYLAG